MLDTQYFLYVSDANNFSIIILFPNNLNLSYENNEHEYFQFRIKFYQLFWLVFYQACIFFITTSTKNFITIIYYLIHN